MATIFDYVTAKEIAAYWIEGASNRTPYLGATLFGKKQLGLEPSWLKARKVSLSPLKPSAFDTKPTLRDRIGFDRLVTEMPFFREAMMITEKDRQNLNNVIASGNEKAIEMIVRNIYDDAAGLIDSAEVVFERMRMQLLSTGKIAITENGNALDYDYQFDSATWKRGEQCGQTWTIRLRSRTSRTGATLLKTIPESGRTELMFESDAPVSHAERRDTGRTPKS